MSYGQADYYAELATRYPGSSDAHVNATIANAYASLAVAGELRRLRAALCGNPADEFTGGAFGELADAIVRGR